MQTYKNYFYLLIFSLSVYSCNRSFDGPPLNAPESDKEANMTIADLKEMYADITNATLIEYKFVLEATVVGNDESGNIYKQLYIQDQTGGISIGIDQNSIYASNRFGQQLLLELHNLYMIKYGNELQIGYGDTNANRLPWQLYLEHVSFKGFPDSTLVAPQTILLSQLNDNLVNTLVKIDNIYFVNGGKNNYTTNDATTDEIIRDGDGNSINVRTSSYSDFANDSLPVGTGSVTGILGRYNGTWQLFLRNKSDVSGFNGSGGEEPGTPTPSGTIFSETFGDGYYPSGSRPKIADFDDFDMKTPVQYSDASGNADVRSMSGNNGPHVWFPAGRDTYLTISGINTFGYESLKLSFELAANLYNAGEATNLAYMTVKCDGQALTMPDTPVSNVAGDDSKFYTFEFEGIPAKENLTIEFFTSAEQNGFGFRLDNIRIYAE